MNPKSLWGYYSGIRAANYFLEESKDLDFYDLRYAQDYAAQMNRFNRYQYEVRLLRAYYYFLLVNYYALPYNFGNPAENLGVPLKLEMAVHDGFMARNSVDRKLYVADRERSGKGNFN